MLDHVIPRDSNTKLLLDKIQKGGRYTVFGFSRAEKLFLTHSIDRPVLYIAQDEQDAKNVLSKMTRPSAMLQSILYPSIQDKNSIYQDTISKIYGLNSGAIEVLVAYPEVLHSYFKINVGHVLLSIDEEYDPKSLLSQLVGFGYRRVESVSEKGDISLHGDSMDIYLDQEETILRLSFFDTTLESITKYSPLTFEKIESLTKK